VLERNLHDGVQQRLVAARIKLALVAERVMADTGIRRMLDELGTDLEAAIDELRDIAHGIYPAVLTDHGLAAALAHVGRQAAGPVVVRDVGVGRHSTALESGVYYCCLEAIQNATKHGGPSVRISIVMREDADELRFTVMDDGPGFTVSTTPNRGGLRNMRERIDTLAGRLSIVSTPGSGTIVSGAVFLRVEENGPTAITQLADHTSGGRSQSAGVIRRSRDTQLERHAEGLDERQDGPSEASVRAARAAQASRRRRTAATRDVVDRGSGI
jgi:signal transduction histidine kinase